MREGDIVVPASSIFFHWLFGDSEKIPMIVPHVNFFLHEILKVVFISVVSISTNCEQLRSNSRSEASYTSWSCICSRKLFTAKNTQESHFSFIKHGLLIRREEVSINGMMIKLLCEITVLILSDKSYQVSADFTFEQLFCSFRILFDLKFM